MTDGEMNVFVKFINKEELKKQSNRHWNMK